MEEWCPLVVYFTLSRRSSSRTSLNSRGISTSASTSAVETLTSSRGRRGTSKEGPRPTTHIHSPLRHRSPSSPILRPGTRSGHIPYRNCMLTMVLKDSLGECGLIEIVLKKQTQCLFSDSHLFLWTYMCMHTHIYPTHTHTHTHTHRWQLPNGHDSYSICRGTEHLGEHIYLQILSESGVHFQQSEVKSLTSAYH